MTALAKLGIAGVVLALASCPSRPADSPVRHAARGAVLAISDGVRIADSVCATVGKALVNADRKDDAIDLTTKCATGYNTARHGLLAAAAAVDAWEAADSTSRLACGASEAISGLSEIRDAVAPHAKIPAEVEDAIQAGAWAARYAEGGASCPR